jgi:hypothetical protein
MLIVACAPKQKAVLRVGTGAEYPPSVIRRRQFRRRGMDITRRIAEKLDMEIQFVKYDQCYVFGLALK